MTWRWFTTQLICTELKLIKQRGEINVFPMNLIVSLEWPGYKVARPQPNFALPLLQGCQLPEDKCPVPLIDL